MVPYFGGRLTFQVIGVTPPASDAVLVTQKTMFHIAERGTALKAHCTGRVRGHSWPKGRNSKS